MALKALASGVVAAMRELTVPPSGIVGVFLSGGIDSAVVLHHLSEKMHPRVINTYTAKFGVSTDETDKAYRVAREYKTRHTEVEITDFLKTLPEIMRLFDRPRYNVWTYWLARKAQEDGVEVIYIGEGSDEIFGYPDRGYLEGWAGQLVWVRPAFDVVCKHFGIEVKAPFTEWHNRMVEEESIFHPMVYFIPPHKELLREAYRELLPPFIVDTPTTAPAMTNYMEFGKKVFGRAFATKEEAVHFFQMAAAKAWLEAHRV